jgi:phosphoglycerate dehydrogenase-like enzyme
MRRAGKTTGVAILKTGFLSKVNVDIEEMKSRFAPEPLDIFGTKEALAGEVGDLEVLIAMNQGFQRFTVDSDILAKAQKLRLVQHIGVATDITDIDAAAARGIPVATVPVQNCRSVAETAMYLLLGCVKKGRTAQRLVDQGAMGEFVCSELSGKTLCLMGLGTIGKMMVPMARGFDMRVIGVRRDASKDGGAIEGVEKIFDPKDLHQALSQSDVVVLALPLDAETANIIDTDALAAMNDDAFLVNLSRGGNVDRAALEAALASNRIAGFGTDVFWQEPNDPDEALLKDERVFATPHSGGKSIEAIRGDAREVHGNVMRLIKGEPLQNVANM